MPHLPTRKPFSISLFLQKKISMPGTKNTSTLRQGALCLYLPHLNMYVAVIMIASLLEWWEWSSSSSRNHWDYGTHNVTDKSKKVALTWRLSVSSHEAKLKTMAVYIITMHPFFLLQDCWDNVAKQAWIMHIQPWTSDCLGYRRDHSLLLSPKGF